MKDYQEQLISLLKLTVDSKASDLHLSVGHPPILRVAGRLIPVPNRRRLNPEGTEGLAAVLMSPERQQLFLRQKEIDFSYSLEDIARFRVNVFLQRGFVSIALRRIPSKIPTIEELNLPPVIREFVKRSQGFVLVTGPSGQGKSTTLATLLDEINHTRAEHIITIEDPIEYVFKEDKSIIDQREVYQDTNSFAKALRATFRQDPDVIMVGEMRDLETIATAITAAETGHLVFATLHTNSAAQTVHRIVDSFPPTQQSQVRAQLAGSLLGVISQRLLPGIRGGLIPACEIMFNTPATANLIRENKIHEIPMIIETSAERGMISLNRSLANLVKANEVSLETALAYSLAPLELKRMIE
jgi:twitching motility protein PilT